jgi:NAD-dependent dihydropyrimidine dehydrogenase PreA subunit
MVCPWGVYSDEGDHIAIVKMEQCVACMSCIPACPVDAITVKEDFQE